MAGHPINLTGPLAAPKLLPDLCDCGPTGFTGPTGPTVQMVPTASQAMIINKKE